jgi:DNA-binding transcriptional LysR family regulator
MENLMLDCHQLNIFLISAQTLNFSEAARRLHLTQPSVSQHINSLEQKFGVSLFNRSGRHISLTAAGESLLPLAREFVRQSCTIEEAMVSLKGEVFGHLQFGCSTTAGKYILPRLLAGYRENFPNVRITCHVKNAITVLEMLKNGEVHIVLSHEQIANKDVEFKLFMQDPVVLVAPPDHPWAKQKSIEAHELLDASFIHREAGSGTLSEVIKGLPKVGLSIDQLNTIMVLGNSEAISLAVQKGIGVAFLSQLVVEAPLERNELVEVDIRGLELSQEIWIGRYRHQTGSLAQSAFWKFVHDPDNPLVRELVPQTPEQIEMKQYLEVQ